MFHKHILEEGNQNYPRCLKCDILVSHKALNGRNLATGFFRRGAERNWRLMIEEEEGSGTDLSITAYGTPLGLVTSFKYLGIFLFAVDDY